MSKSKKAFVVYPRTKKQAREGLVINGKRKKFTGGSMMNLFEDDAKQVSESYGKQNVHIVEDEQLGRALNGEKWDVKGDNVKTLHNYNFGTTKAYSDAWEEFEKRRKDKDIKPKKKPKQKRLPAAQSAEE